MELPPVELPKELWRRLVEAGELGDGELPAGVDPDVLVTLRQSYQQRSAQPVLQVLAEPVGSGWCQDGQAVVIFDGLDELFGPQVRKPGHALPPEPRQHRGADLTPGIQARA